MLNSILATFVVCLGMSTKGMPISNYDDQEKTQIATTLQPKQVLTEQNDNIQITNIDYDSYAGGNWPAVSDTTNYDRQTYGTIGYQTQGLTITGQYTYEYFPAIDWNTNVQWIEALDENAAITWAQYGDFEEYEPILEYTTSMMFTYKIVPTNYNKDTKITYDLLKLFGVYNGQFLILTISSLDNYYDDYITINSRQFINQYKYEHITNINAVTQYSVNYEIVKPKPTFNPVTEYNYYQVEQKLNIVANRTNYIYTFILPLMDSPMDSPQPWAMEQPLELQDNDINIENTNIIPEGDYEAIDLPGVMFYILTMPFSFISQAFNLTLFPGTDFQLNISNLFLVLIAVMIFVFIMKLLVKMQK